MSRHAAFPEPPSEASLKDARRSLESNLASSEALSKQITDAELSLRQMVHEAECAIAQLREEKVALEDNIERTRGYLSPIRRLPVEVLRMVFMSSFEMHPCSAWILASVCRTWRHLALNMPRIWSKIRLNTTQHSTADTVRLWLDRSGRNTPLDIEIHLRATKSDALPVHTLRRTSSLVFQPPTHAWGMITSPPAVLPPIAAPNDPWSTPPSPTSSDDSSPPRETTRGRADSKGNAGPKSATHWGHIAIFYLVQQMSRWKRFIFRFDKKFDSLFALRNIVGDAPLLEEFEISAGETATYYQQEWNWLPSSTTASLPQIRHLTLQLVPFKWTSTVFRGQLHTLHLRSLSNQHMSVDRILHIIRCSKDTLRSLSIHFQVVLANILPLNSLSLNMPELRELSIGGHHLLSSILEMLTAPSLEELNLDVDAREPIEELIQNLVTRAPDMALRHLSIGYGFGCGRASTLKAAAAQAALCSSASSPSSVNPPAAVLPTPNIGSSTYYYPGLNGVLSWGFLQDLSHLTSLRVGGTPMESILSMLGVPDDDMLVGGPSAGSPFAGAAPVPSGPGNGANGGGGGAAGQSAHNANAAGGLGWACPNLVDLRLKHCSAHGGAGEHGGVGKLVQVIDSRNPEQSTGPTVINGLAPKRLKVLELNDCVALGEDVVTWLRGKVPEVLLSSEREDSYTSRRRYIM